MLEAMVVIALSAFSAVLAWKKNAIKDRLLPDHPAAVERAKKKRYLLSKDEQRRADAVARRVRYGELGNHPRHIDAVVLVGPTSETGTRTKERLRI